MWFVVTAGKMKDKSCPSCCKLFLAKSERGDRRPLVACGNGDAICADCYTERRGQDGKCPACGDELLREQTVNKPLLELIESYASVPEIPAEELTVDKNPIAKERMKYKI